MTDTASIFRRLHNNTIPLRLPNVWDAGSARLFESLGAEAIATSSAGLSWALGYCDGRILPIDELVASAARIARVLTVPLSVDIENGYSDDPGVVADLVKRLIDLGVAGITSKMARISRRFSRPRLRRSEAPCPKQVRTSL